MRDFKKLIQYEAEKLYRLNVNINEAYKKRSKDISHWKKACEEFHLYVSEIDPFLRRVYEDSEYTCDEQLEFVICFLEVDPIFFRSGYIKEEILRKIKRAKLTKNQMNRLRNILIQAVKDRGSREYKAYCRLAIRIADANLISSLESIFRNNEGALKSRAKLMLQYVS